jgi:hypothetical protein
MLKIKRYINIFSVVIYCCCISLVDYILGTYVLNVKVYKHLFRHYLLLLYQLSRLHIRDVCFKCKSTAIPFRDLDRP